MRFWAMLMSTILGLSLVWLALFAGQLGLPTASSRWVAETIAIKQERANVLVGQRKLVIVAGSNALFGLDSKRLEQQFGFPVINAAVNAGLLLPYVLYSADHWIKPGDIVLMPLEYPMFNHNSDINGIVIDYVLARDPDYLSSLSLVDRFRFVLHTSPERLLRGWLTRQDPPVGHGVYGGHHVDAWGDQTHTSVHDQTDQDRAELDRSRTWRYGQDSQPNAKAWSILRNYHRALRERGACLIMMPPAFLGNPLYASDPVEKSFYTTLPEKVRAMEIAYVGSPYQFMYSQQSFFNTDYHLTADARIQHTERVITLLGQDLESWCGAARK